VPDLWLAVIQARTTRNQLWSAPQNDVDRWMDAVDDKDFLDELGLNAEVVLL
jgi:hypothetical protein